MKLREIVGVAFVCAPVMALLCAVFITEGITPLLWAGVAISSILLGVRLLEE